MPATGLSAAGAAIAGALASAATTGAADVADSVTAGVTGCANASDAADNTKPIKQLFNNVFKVIRPYQNHGRGRQYVPVDNVAIRLLFRGLKCLMQCNVVHIVLHETQLYQSGAGWRSAA